MTQFRDGFMKASPVKQIAGDRAERLRKRAQRKSERSGETGGYNYSDPKVVKLLDKAKKIENKNFIKSTGAKKGSKRKGSRYGEDARVSASYERPDMDTSPLNGYVDGEERVSHHQPTADLYQNLFNTLQTNVDKIAEASTPENMAKRKAMKAQRLGKRIDKIDQKLPKDTGETYTYIDDDGEEIEEFFVDPTINAKEVGKRNKLARKQAEAIVDQTEFEDIANKKKQNSFDKLLALMSKEDKEKYGLTTDTTT